MFVSAWNLKMPFFSVPLFSFFFFLSKREGGDHSLYQSPIGTSKVLSQIHCHSYSHLIQCGVSRPVFTKASSLH